MEVGSSLLAQSLRGRITPVILLLPTPAVEESCARNSLSFLDLLRPFSFIDQIDVPVRTASDQPYRLQEFRLRMFYSAEICQPSVEIAEEYLLKLVNNSSDEALSELPGDPRDLEVVKQMIQTESLSSWFQRYCRAFIQSLSFSEHETIDHPVACLRAVSSRDENPIHKFVELYENDPMPASLSDGTMDPKLLKIYVLIHDYQDGPADRANEILSEMRATFGVNDCWLLCINSGEPNTVGEEFWKTDILSLKSSSENVTSSTSDTRLGSFLSDNDLSEISEVIMQVCCKAILPYMEQKVRSLNQQVVATKRGLRNQIKNLWWRKGKDEVPDPTSTAMYTCGSIESQIRVLADYAFMLHDYELALSNYRLISSDYKADKAWKHYAGTQEMTGLSLFMLDQSRKEAELCMEAAFGTYQKSVPSGQRHSTRCALWWSEMHKARVQFKEAANVFFRAGTEEPHLRAGIFLEQASYCYLRANPPMLRKYGFFLVLAGNRYNVCGQKKHALRAYTSVLTIFEGQGWNYINDHVIFHLGRLSAHLGNFMTAVQHFQKLISCSHQSPTNQVSFLKEFVQAVQNAKLGKDELLLLDLPSIRKEDARVHFEDHRTYASAAAALLPDDMWGPLEMNLIPFMRTSTWLDVAASRSSVAEVIHSNDSIAGETITVEVEFGNPLQVPLNLSSVALICTFAKEGVQLKEGNLDAGGDSTSPQEADLEPAMSEDGFPARDDASHSLVEQHNSSLTVEEEAFTLRSLETHKAQLKVVPHEKGLLCILGVKWTLSGIVRGYQMFTPGGTKAKPQKGDRIPPPYQRLKFAVREQMPRLEVSLHGMPEKVNAGELHRVVLELSNSSNIVIKNLKFCTSHPGVLLVGQNQDLDAEFPNCLEAPFVENQEIGGMSSEMRDANTSIHVFPQTVVLESGSTLLWPLWLHAREAGTLLLNSVLYYEASDETPRVRYRTVRLSHSLQVFPSLQVSVHISSCLLRLKQRLLRLDIANRHAAESFWLRQVSCVAGRWQIAPLLPPVTDTETTEEMDEGGIGKKEDAFLSASVSPSQLLPAGQSLSLFFQLLDAEKKNTTSFAQGLISNVRLGPPSSGEPLIDVTRGPVHNFHAHAKQDRRSSSIREPPEAFEGTLDVILISEQQHESLVDKPAALRDGRLATHHICHCSLKQSSPLVWLMEGPSAIAHDFTKDPCCKIPFYLTIKNNFHGSVSVRVFMAPNTNSSLSKPGHHNGIGWYDLSLETSSDPKANEKKDRDHAFEGESAFMWTSFNSFKIDRLESEGMETYPLDLAVFAPGIYDVSGYHVSWELLNEPLELSRVGHLKGSASLATPSTFASGYVPPDVSQFVAGKTVSDGDDDLGAFVGSGSGHPFFLTVEDKR